MLKAIKHNRRRFLGTAAASIFTEMALMGTAHASFDKPKRSEFRFTPIKQIKAGVLDIGYYEAGPSDGAPVLLLHGFPYSIDSYIDVAPMLAARGCRVIVPYLRGHGTTRFLDSATPRSGQQAAIGVDAIALMDVLQLNRAVLAGYDWGGRAACVVAALWPERCTGLVSVNSYLIQDIAKAGLPLSPAIKSGIWYQYYFQTERGRAGLTANRREIAKILWTRNSPNWHFDEATLDQHASAFDNPDYVEVVIHSYRHRLGLAAFLSGREAIVQFLTCKWLKELEYRLIKELWAFQDNRVAVRFAYEWHDNAGNWFRSYSNENWEFDEHGFMRWRIASINDLPIHQSDRKYHWILGRRPDEHPGLSDLNL